ncbi:MAG: DUF2141 domain-containing protein [Xanthomonadales bacterium]|jgi:uncharacterized protein (DUF2141 family)|nr:DUF2141 domain-containing protein [Xanthomonadales bacterium]
MFSKISRLTILALLLSPALARAELPALTVNVVDAHPASGTIEITLFNSAESFLKQTYVQRPCQPDADGRCSVTFAALEEGDYAVVVVHDANDNKKLDNGFLGFGAESFAYSNGASNPLFGRADFEDARIRLTETVTIEISLD